MESNTQIIFPSDLLYEHYLFKVDPNQSLLRIDKFLMDKISNITRNKLQSAIDDKFVLVNSKPIKSNYKVKPHDAIKIMLPTPPRESEVKAEKLNLDIVFEDEELMIINKPSGMVVHPAYNNWSGTLVNGLSYLFKDLPNKKGNIGRPGLVHRIDKDTSGLLVIAKTDFSMAYLAKQFADHTITRRYVTLVWGDPETEEGTIDAHLGRNPKDRKKIEVTTNIELGKKAVTHYKIVEKFNYVTLLECNLETGRTHQIRAHLKHIGHTIFGDTVYGGNIILKGPRFSKYKAFIENCFKLMPHQALHAKTLGFIHPKTKEYMEFNIEVPSNYKILLEKWRNYVSPYK